MNEMPPIPDFPPKPWWWLSFVDPDRPAGQRSLGACIVQGKDLGEAVENAWAQECNPGGEIAAFPIPFSKMDKVPAECRNRLMTREECQERGF